MIQYLADYFYQNIFPISIGGIIGGTIVWFLCKIFLYFRYEDYEIEKNFKAVESKLDKISNHLGVNQVDCKKKENK